MVAKTFINFNVYSGDHLMHIDDREFFQKAIPLLAQNDRYSCSLKARRG